MKPARMLRHFSVYTRKTVRYNNSVTARQAAVIIGAGDQFRSEYAVREKPAADLLSEHCNGSVKRGGCRPSLQGEII